MSERLRRTRDVKAVLSHGHVGHGAHAVVRLRDRDEVGPPRWTVSASRRVGTAVARNRAKRRLRAALRTLNLPEGMDVVVIARASARTCGFADLVSDVADAVTQATDRAPTARTGEARR